MPRRTGRPGQPDRRRGRPRRRSPTPDAAPFDPAHQPDFNVWAHDDTVQPGKTYRYQLRYVISSPVFLTQQLCNPQALANQFSITSSPADQWTDPVNVESDSNFYAARSAPAGRSSSTSSSGRAGTGEQSDPVAPGDTVGSPDRHGRRRRPFATGWTVVDVRDVPNDIDDRVVLLASDNGTLQREVKIDSQDQHYRDLLKRSPKDAQGERRRRRPAPATAPPGHPARPGRPGQDSGPQEAGPHPLTAPTRFQIWPTAAATVCRPVDRPVPSCHEPHHHRHDRHGPRRAGRPHGRRSASAARTGPTSRPGGRSSPSRTGRT